MGGAALVEQLVSARQQLDLAGSLLMKPSPEGVERCSTILEEAGRQLAQWQPEFSRQAGDAAALEEAWRLRRSFQRTSRLLQGAADFHTELAAGARRHDRRLYRNRRIRAAITWQPDLPGRVTVMSNLLASLVSSAGTLEAYGRVLETAQNNVANASTPGYAKQRLDLYALPFDPSAGVTGGVRAGKLVSARSEYAEQAVRQQTSGLGYQQQLVDNLTAIQANFDISGNQGIPQALNNLFQSFSAWGATPDNTAARQTVIQRATDLARAFQQTAHDVSGRARDAEMQIGQTVEQVNQLVGEIRGYNHIALQGNKGDAGLRCPHARGAGGVVEPD